jgi:hypothetical protein
MVWTWKVSNQVTLKLRALQEALAFQIKKARMARMVRAIFWKL